MNQRIWSIEEKATVVLEMLKGQESVAAVCDRHGVSATQAYHWQEQFPVDGRATLPDKRTRGAAICWQMKTTALRSRQISRH